MKKIQKKFKKAFTLMEILLVLAIIGIAATMAYQAWEEGYVKERTTAEKLQMLAEIRLAGKEMMKEARNANVFYIFESFPAEIDNEGVVTQGTAVPPGSTGNYLVLDSVLFGNVVERTGYYLEGATLTNGGEIKKFRETYNGTGVPPLPTDGTGHRVLLQNVIGNNEDGQLFYNADGTAILVEGKFSEDIKQFGGSSKGVNTTRTFTYQLQPISLN